MVNVSSSNLNAVQEDAVVYAVAASLGIATSGVTVVSAVETTAAQATAAHAVVQTLITAPVSLIDKYNGNSTEYIALLMVVLHEAVYTGTTTRYLRERLRESKDFNNSNAAIIAVRQGMSVPVPSSQPIAQVISNSQGGSGHATINQALIMGLIFGLLALGCTSVPVYFLIKGSMNQKKEGKDTKSESVSSDSEKMSVKLEQMQAENMSKDDIDSKGHSTSIDIPNPSNDLRQVGRGLQFPDIYCDNKSYDFVNNVGCPTTLPMAISSDNMQQNVYSSGSRSPKVAQRSFSFGGRSPSLDDRRVPCAAPTSNIKTVTAERSALPPLSPAAAEDPHEGAYPEVVNNYAFFSSLYEAAEQRGGEDVSSESGDYLSSDSAEYRKRESEEFQLLLNQLKAMLGMEVAQSSLRTERGTGSGIGIASEGNVGNDELQYDNRVFELLLQEVKSILNRRGSECDGSLIDDDDLSLARKDNEFFELLLAEVKAIISVRRSVNLSQLIPSKATKVSESASDPPVELIHPTASIDTLANAVEKDLTSSMLRKHFRNPSVSQKFRESLAKLLSERISDQSQQKIGLLHHMKGDRGITPERMEGDRGRRYKNSSTERLDGDRGRRYESSREEGEEEGIESDDSLALPSSNGSDGNTKENTFSRSNDVDYGDTYNGSVRIDSNLSSNHLRTARSFRSNDSLTYDRTPYTVKLDDIYPTEEHFQSNDAWKMYRGSAAASSRGLSSFDANSRSRVVTSPEVLTKGLGLGVGVASSPELKSNAQPRSVVTSPSVQDIKKKFETMIKQNNSVGVVNGTAVVVTSSSPPPPRSKGDQPDGDAP